MHNPPCPTWAVHLRRCYVDVERFVGLGAFVDDVLHSWEQELLMGDPEFFADLDRMLAETRASMDVSA